MSPVLDAVAAKSGTGPPGVSAAHRSRALGPGTSSQGAGFLAKPQVRRSQGGKPSAVTDHDPAFDHEPPIRAVVFALF